MWREWMVTVHKTDDDRVDVSLQAFMHPALEDQGKCLGYVSSFYGNPEVKGTCVIPPYGNGLFLNATLDEEETGSQTWTVQESGGGETDVFRLVASNKPAACSRFVGAMDCASSAFLVGDAYAVVNESSTYASWRLIKRYDVVPVASPPPPSPPPPPPPPPPPARIPGPTIQPSMYGQTVVVSGFIEITVVTFGGSDQCVVESIVFTSVSVTSGASTSTPPYRAEQLRSLSVSVPLMPGSEYEVLAQGVCSSGAVTQRSNVLTVRSMVATPGAPAGRCTRADLSATTDWALGCGQTGCTEICQGFGKSCVVAGMQSVDTEAKGRFVAGLFYLPITVADGDPAYPDQPVIDYQSPRESELYYNGQNSDCDAQGLYSYSRRFCCCGPNCPVQ
jgi:hypothetical protein